MSAWSDGPNAGFTILELLVSLCILALISTYTVAALQSLRHMDDLVRRIETRHGLEAVRNHLHHMLSEARPVVALDGQLQPVVAFRGEEAQIRLVASSDGILETGGLHSVLIEARPRGEGLADLIARRSLFRPAAPPNVEETLVLYERIAGLRLRYMGPAKAEGPSGWRSSWVDKDTLPRLIEIIIDLPEQASRNQARLIVRPASGP